MIKITFADGSGKTINKLTDVSAWKSIDATSNK